MRTAFIIYSVKDRSGEDSLTVCKIILEIRTVNIVHMN